MKTVNLSKWSIQYPDSICCIFDANEEKAIFVTKEYDEIHLVVEVLSGKLVFQPRWSVSIIELDKFTYEIKTNN